ncbi:MAG TPA: glycosyltransferase [Candidatus Eisenbacteria bacterium]|jgi:glycosyltransferase involved in cell wall biosynthesis|nr:glycosyltransferase [Candidatus Eisenbacteria bacterium]
MSLAFSVLVTTRDRPALLADALASIARQTLLPIEIRVADTSASPVGELPPRVGDVPLIFVDLPGARAAQARNQMGQDARGEAVALLDDDDRWRPGHLEGLAGALAMPGTRFAFRDSVVVREHVADGVRHDLETRLLAHDWDDRLMRTDDFIPPSAWGLEASLLRELAGFDPLFRFSDDWDFLLRAREKTVPVRVAGVTVEVRMREGGNASADFGPERLADLRQLEKRHRLRRLEPKTFWEVAETVSQSG